MNEKEKEYSEEENERVLKQISIFCCNPHNYVTELLTYMKLPTPIYNFCYKAFCSPLSYVKNSKKKKKYNINELLSIVESL